MAAGPPSERPPWMPPADESDGPPPWDQDEADWLVGKYALVGITYLAPDGETVTSQGQYHGKIVSADSNDGFRIECEGKWVGKTLGLPPMLSAFQLADPGEYKLRSTGETVKDPEVLATWSITAAQNKS
jgi:hypothetical protein